MKWIQKNKELLAWCIALLLPAFIDPRSEEHFTVCLFHHLGFTACPGCGLGRSLAWLYQGDLLQSFQTHYFAVPALLILLYRIFQLAKPLFKITPA